MAETIFVGRRRGPDSVHGVLPTVALADPMTGFARAAELLRRVLLRSGRVRARHCTSFSYVLLKVKQTTTKQNRQHLRVARS
ncbi:hypothetical protein HBB16_13270 [Pseudonocardia sp. MCCB 268]|nr:hypothetical protein [Pseudonocardia cytotoxica]